MYRGARYRMVANDFAVPRMDPGKQRPIQSMEEARQWERLMAQTPPLFKKSPFHRFGVRMNKKLETTRDRRLTREEERRLGDAEAPRLRPRAEAWPRRRRLEP
jgi:hypothetical protein